MQQALELAEQACEQGVTHLMCTPHIHAGVFNNDKQIIAEVFQALLDELAVKNIPLFLSYAAEVRVGADITHSISRAELPFLGKWGNKSALLLELPHSHIPAGIERVVSWLHKQGIQVVIPHPERNRDVLANYNKATWLKSLGALFQVTAGAFVGTFGSAAQDISFRLLNDNLVDYVASDMHNLHKRPNQMKEAFETIRSIRGEQVAKRLFIDTPKSLTNEINWLQAIS